MIFINIFVLLLYLMLAIISRKHFSKYKGIKKILYAMSDFIFSLVEKRINMERIIHSIRRLRVVGSKQVKTMAKDYIKKNISICLFSFLIFNVVSLLLGILNLRVAGGNNILYREDYGGNAVEYDISLTYDGEQSNVSLFVEPIEYTLEEFYEKSEQLFSEFEKELVGENKDLLHIRGDIDIPENSQKGFLITWQSDNPNILSPTGKVFNDDLKDKAYATLTATIEYDEFSVSHDYLVGIEGKGEPEKIDAVCGLLTELERENRNSREIHIPKNISGVEVSIKQDENNTAIYIFLLGILFCIILVYRKAYSLKQGVKDRDRRLMDLYPWFVNSLWLFLGAGLTVKSGIKKLTEQNEDGNLLVLELKYAVNQIDSGMDECDVYEALGKSLGLGTYERLLQQLSRNLKIGTKNLLELMEEELTVAMKIREENAKRKGEEASTKLLFPMTVLLLIVMLIIVVPVMISL